MVAEVGSSILSFRTKFKKHKRLNMNQFNSSFTYRSLQAMIKTVPEGDYVEIYYFILKTTKGLFKIARPKKCRIKVDSRLSYRKDVAFNYQTAKGNWSSIHEYSFKHNAYYFATLQEAEAAFKAEVINAKEHFTNQINSANIALSELDLY